MNQKLRDDMMRIKGKMEALCFPLTPDYGNGFGDLVDSINGEYESILKRLFEDYEE